MDDNYLYLLRGKYVFQHYYFSTSLFPNFAIYRIKLKKKTLRGKIIKLEAMNSLNKELNTIYPVSPQTQQHQLDNFCEVYTQQAITPQPKKRNIIKPKVNKLRAPRAPEQPIMCPFRLPIPCSHLPHPKQILLAKITYITLILLLPSFPRKALFTLSSPQHGQTTLKPHINLLPRKTNTWHHTQDPKSSTYPF